MKKFPKIVFIGSNFFSFSFLKKLHLDKYNLIGIITNPTNKRNYISYPIQKYAIKNKIPLLQPMNLLDLSFFKILKNWNPDLQIVVSFRILPKKIWTLPKLGTINIHPSLLPQYRGAAPINWAIINGEKKTGLTIFFIGEKIDSGKIIFQKDIKIGKDQTAGSLQSKLKKIGKKMLTDVLNQIIIKKKFFFQKKIYFSSLKYAPKIFNKDCQIQWKNSTLESIYNKIRGLNPTPTAWTYLYFDEKKFYRLKIFSAKKEKKIHSNPIGIVFFESKTMKISVKNGFIHIMECQIEGKKKMNIKNFINGIQTKKNIFVK